MRQEASQMRTVIAACLGFLFGIAVTWAVIGGPMCPYWPPPLAKEWGEFPVRAKVELLDESRQIRLLEDLIYIDPRGR